MVKPKKKQVSNTIDKKAMIKKAVNVTLALFGLGCGLITIVYLNDLNCSGNGVFCNTEFNIGLAKASIFYGLLSVFFISISITKNKKKIFLSLLIGLLVIIGLIFNAKSKF